AVQQLEEQFAKLGTPDTFATAAFTADSGFHSEKNLQFMATTGLDTYIADTKFRSRNPLFKTSETYHTEKRRLKRSKGRPKLFSSNEFNLDIISKTCRCPAGKSMRFRGDNVKSEGKLYTRFQGELSDCENCALRAMCMRNPPKKEGRQVQFLNDTVKNITFTAKMRVKIDSSIGRRQYSKRLGMIEPVFGNITVNKGMNKFTLRGKGKVNAQWQMYCLVHNIEKLRNSLH
ncbi:MAG: transposase, partial [Psychroserpens sp.]|nr:transposase [Psychroserpens sp.]